MTTETIRNEYGWPACGHSLERADLTTSFTVHYAPESELNQYGGVCASCWRAFRKRNGSLAAEKTESPVDMNQKPGALSVEQDHAGWVAPGVIEPSTEFAWDEIDPETAEHFNTVGDDVRRESAQALGLILRWIWSRGWETAQRRFAAFSASLDPSLLDNATYTEIAKRCGCSKAAISKTALVCSEKFNVRWGRSRTDDARKNMATARLRQVLKRPDSLPPPMKAIKHHPLESSDGTADCGYV